LPVLTRSRILALAAVVLALALAFSGPRDIGDSPSAFYTAFGHGPTVVLVHGLGSRADHWLATARRLSRTHRVVLVDLPGHGASAMPTPFSLERATTSLDLALAAEGRGPVVLVGHSLGGLVAASEALAHPERVRALVLVETALRPQVEGADRDALLQMLDHDYRALIESAYVAFGRDSAQGMELYAEVSSLDSTMVKSWIRLAATADLSEAAGHLEPPVLAVLAERSWPKDESWSETAQALGYDRIRHVEPLRFESCGHFIMLDRPVELADAIARFAAQPEREPIASR
jgi:pimeloyl-ACP methyl ester carboxylesterase